MAAAAPPGQDVLLATHDLVVGRRAPLLTDVQLQFAAGQHWCVVGRNGGGKTTLLLTLLGLLPPLAGSVRWSGSLLDRRRLGYVPQEQDRALALPCTVAEFVALGATTPRGAATRAAVGAGLAAIGLGDLANRDLRRLSLGQRRRVLVARALVRQPLLLALDEPSANLDDDAAALLTTDLQRLCREGLCVVHVTHDLAMAERTATHLARLAAGKVTVREVAGVG
ncbi:MAG: hypothetical protein RL398_1030 [Planctomycetota bacterium]|jgi:ABC-type Mn2+/Zn2+ transport system ATPase subunit